MDKKIMIVGIETDNGVYIKKDGEYHGFPNYLFDGAYPQKTFMDNWGLIKSIPKKIEYVKSQPNINYRYRLKTDLLEDNFSGKTLGRLQPELKREDVAEKVEYEWIWKTEFRHLQSLYELISDKQPDLILPLDCDFKIILKIDKIKKYAGISFTINSGRWEKYTTTIKDSDVKHQLLDKIIFPEPILPSRPSMFTSEQIYRIIRYHVKQNIDYRICDITSDYDFCFTVKKRIRPISETMETLLSEKNEKRLYGRKKMEMFTVFEMTHAGENYRGYTAIPPLYGKNHQDLKRKTVALLKRIMKIINTPAKICSNCKGGGVMDLK